jgi:hypothetical protein
MATASGSSVICNRCGEMSLIQEVIEHPKGRQGPQVEVYQCQACKARQSLICEPVGGLDDEQLSWVEREVERRGSFFPSDYGGGGGRFGR